MADTLIRRSAPRGRTAPGEPAGGRAKPRRPRRAFHAPRSANLFYLPAIALFAVITVYPLISGFGLSLTNWNGYSAARSAAGLSNYARLFTDANFGDALRNTVLYGVGSTLVQQVIGLALALALDRALRGRNVARAIIYLPALVSPVVMGTMYYLFFQYNNGVLNNVVGVFGKAPVAWLSSTSTALLVIVLVNSLQFVGVSMVIYLAGLQSIPQMYTEAAMLDGAGSWQRFKSITLPLLQPAFATSIVLNLIGGLKLFDIIKVLTGGGPGYSTNSVSTLIGVTYFDGQKAGYASAMGIVLFAIIVLVTVAINTVLNRFRLEES